MSPGPTRRTVLGLAPVVLLAACTGSEPAPVPVDPDDALRAGAAERERGLLRLYDGAVRADPALGSRLAPLRAHHEERLAALVGPAATAGPSAAPAATPPAPPAATPPPVTLAALVAAERAAGAAHSTDCLAARDRDLAALLASLSAGALSSPVALA